MGLCYYGGGQGCPSFARIGRPGGLPHVEFAVGEGEVFCVGLLELNIGVGFGLGTHTSVIEQAGHIVRAGHLTPAARGGQRGIAVSGGNVQHAGLAAHGQV